MRDLIDECGQDLANIGYRVKKDKMYAIEVANLSIDTPEKERFIGFDKGEYVVLTSPLTHMLDRECHDYVAKILADNLKKNEKK